MLSESMGSQAGHGSTPSPGGAERPRGPGESTPITRVRRAPPTGSWESATRCVALTTPATLTVSTSARIPARAPRALADGERVSRPPGDACANSHSGTVGDELAVFIGGLL